MGYDEGTVDRWGCLPPRSNGLFWQGQTWERNAVALDYLSTCTELGRKGRRTEKAQVNCGRTGERGSAKENANARTSERESSGQLSDHGNRRDWLRCDHALAPPLTHSLHYIYDLLSCTPPLWCRLRNIFHVPGYFPQLKKEAQWLINRLSL